MYIYPKLEEAQKIAKDMGLAKPRSSQRKNKKLYVIYKHHEIHFGDRRYTDYLLSGDEVKRDKFRKRMGAKLNKDGSKSIHNKFGAAFYAYHILW
jgi:hypothetical protein